MANEHLRLKHHHIVDGCWWWEQNDGIRIIVHHTGDDNLYSHVEDYLIPWRDIRAALKRKDLPKAEKKS